MPAMVKYNPKASIEANKLTCQVQNDYTSNTNQFFFADPKPVCAIDAGLLDDGKSYIWKYTFQSNPIDVPVTTDIQITTKQAPVYCKMQTDAYYRQNENIVFNVTSSGLRPGLSYELVCQSMTAGGSCPFFIEQPVGLVPNVTDNTPYKMQVLQSTTTQAQIGDKFILMYKIFYKQSMTQKTICENVFEIVGTEPIDISTSVQLLNKNSDVWLVDPLTQSYMSALQSIEQTPLEYIWELTASDGSLSYNSA